MKKYYLFILLIYSYFSHAIVYYNNHNSQKINLSAQNSLGSKNIILSASDLDVTEITGYSIGSNFTIDTPDGGFVVTDGSFGDGIIVNIYAPDGSLFGIIGGSYGDFINGDYFHNGFVSSSTSTTPATLMTENSQTLETADSYESVLAALPDHSLIFNAAPKRYKLSKSLSESNKFRYLSQFGSDVRGWIYQLFQVITRENLVPFFTYVLGREITTTGKRMLLQWYDDFLGENTSP